MEGDFRCMRDRSRALSIRFSYIKSRKNLKQEKQE